MIKCENIAIGYGTRVIQHDMSFELHDGELVALLGANGCGKSTLLRTLAGLQPLLNGSYSLSANSQSIFNSQSIVNGQSLNRQSSRLIALVLTERLSVESATVRDVVAMGRYPYTSFLGTLTAADHRIVNEAMEQVGVADLADSFYNDHSDGEKQRILIAKALAQQTPVILLDEPTAHLDLPSRIKTLKLLHDIAHTQNKTILISTHELDLALRTADRVLLMYPKNQGFVLDTPQAIQKGEALRLAFGIDVLSIM
ncbi:MAG: ABC transporter ATP-binding protein [Paludibacteraceae bacterium]|nr:ABC transporter ATP-binding protein [Paludibacteraceae bacterium]